MQKNRFIWLIPLDYDKVVLHIIRQGADINSQNIYGNTVLHMSAALGYDKFLKYLIELGADVNTVNEEGNTPLHVAVYNGFSKSAKLLIDAGADINLSNNVYLRSPLNFDPVLKGDQSHRINSVCCL